MRNPLIISIKIVAFAIGLVICLVGMILMGIMYIVGCGPNLMKWATNYKPKEEIMADLLEEAENARKNNRRKNKSSKEADKIQ